MNPNRRYAAVSAHFARNFIDESLLGSVWPKVTLWHFLPPLNSKALLRNSSSSLLSVLSSVIFLLFHLIGSSFLSFARADAKTATIFRLAKLLIDVQLEIAEKIFSYCILPCFYWLCETGASKIPASINIFSFCVFFCTY